MQIDELAPEALRLPARDRAILAASLWESILDPFDLSVDRSEEDTIALAFERDAEIESGKVQTLSHKELMSCLRSEN